MDNLSIRAATLTHRSLATSIIREHSGYVYNPVLYFPVDAGSKLYHRVTSLDAIDMKAPFDPDWLACHEMFSTWIDLGRVSCEIFNKQFLTLGFLKRLKLLVDEFSINMDDHDTLVIVERMAEKVV